MQAGVHTLSHYANIPLSATRFSSSAGRESVAEYFIVRIAFTCGLIQRSAAAIMLIAVAERHYPLREWRWILEKLSTAACKKIIFCLAASELF